MLVLLGIAGEANSTGTLPGYCTKEAAQLGRWGGGGGAGPGGGGASSGLAAALRFAKTHVLYVHVHVYTRTPVYACMYRLNDNQH